MNKFFRLHDYSENMKERISIFNLKGKANIWWEDANNVRGIGNSRRGVDLDEVLNTFQEEVSI